jgi:hypothetical protein
MILDCTRGLVHQLNGTASLVWKGCTGNRSVHDIAAEVAATFDVSIDTAQRDVETTVRQLAELRLLVDAGGAAEGTGRTGEEG